MEEKTDKVVGYIEYLGAGGMIGEIVPYTSVEKFKDLIYYDAQGNISNTNLTKANHTLQNVPTGMTTTHKTAQW